MRNNEYKKYLIYSLCFVFLVFGGISLKYSSFTNVSQNSFSDSAGIQNKIVDYKVLTIKSNTVCSTISDKSHCVDKLSANAYISDKSSNKWVVLIHGYTGNGNSMYNSYGAMYENQGYNILTPDLRGHGSSGGGVAFGYLESLDIYDWIKDLNNNWSGYGVSVAPNTIIVHGHSLGGATTLQLATNPDIAKASGTAPYTKSLTQLKVKGFIDDAGFSSIIGISPDISYTNSSKIINSFIDAMSAEAFLNEYNIGLTVDNFAKYSNAFSNGRAFPSGSKVMVIHGLNDDTVPIVNADRVIDNVSPGILVHTWKASDAAHYSLNTEKNINTYTKLVENFTKCVENTSCKSISRN